MQNKVLNEVAIEQMDDLIKAVKGSGGGDSGSGKLYQHKIAYTNINGDIFGYSTFYSSKSLQCSSLSDLKTLLGDNFNIAAYPPSNFIINSWIPLSLDNSNMMIFVHGSVDMNKLGYDAFTITDTVTTI